MKWGFGQRLILGGFGASLCLTGVVNFVSYQNAIQLIKSTEQVKQTHSILEHLAEIQATLNEAESGRRGYLLFGTQAELIRYERAIATLSPIVEKLMRYLVQNPEQLGRLEQMRTYIEERQHLFQQSNDLFYNNPTALSANHPLVKQSSKNREQLRKILFDMKQAEELSLKIWVDRTSISIQHRMVIEWMGALLSFCIICLVYVLLYRELEKRQEAERLQHYLEQEKELGKIKLQFFSMVSHEFRTPLSVILGSAQMLNENLAASVEPFRLRGLRRIEASAKRMRQLLSDILMLARADAGKLEYEPKTMELQSFCLNLAEDMEAGDEHQHLIKLINLGDRTHAKLDERLVYLALSNLLSNALKYSQSGSTIEFTLNGQPDSVIFRVKDCGVGMTAETQAFLFEPFSRGSNVGEVAGTGLGMAVVKRCVELHQGKIVVDSELKKGTTITLFFPQ